LRAIRRNSQNTTTSGPADQPRQQLGADAELGGVAVTDFTPSALSCWLSVVVGWPGMTVV